MLNHQLVDAALGVRGNARAPYSRFAVGAPLLSESSEIFTGCDIENVSLGLTICAERAAVVGAVAKDGTDSAAITGVSDSKQPIRLCGGCRQIPSEFNSEMEIVATTIDGRRETYRSKELLPRSKQGIMEPRQNV